MRTSFGSALAVFTALATSACPPPAPPADAAPADAAVDGPAVDAQPAADAPDADAPPPATRVTATTAQGAVTGLDDGTVRAFLALPYAAPPTGPRRWRPPAPPESWTAPRDATTLGPHCPIRSGTTVSGDEDCLQLNVWTAARDATDRLPVLVWIHGGGFTEGSGTDPLYDGRALAARGHAVVVTINYRLGQLGFLAHPALSAEDTARHVSGNYGLLDQQAALAWVRDNAGAFGGDGGNVTLFGESAGAISVCAHLVAPGSRGLFHRAISESGSCSFIYTPLRTDPARPYESAEAFGQQFATALGCDGAPDAAACMRGKSAEQVLAALPRDIADLDGREAHYAPIVDGAVIAESPWAAIRAGRFARVPYITGANRNEGTGFVQLGTMVNTWDDFATRVRAVLPDHVADVQALYPPAMYATPNDALAAFITDVVFVCPARAHARAFAAAGVNAYLYHFVYVTDFGRLTNLGVFHGGEVGFVFGNLAWPFNNPAVPNRAMAGIMMDTWLRFAVAGDPNNAALGGARWEPFASPAGPYMELSTQPAARADLSPRTCDVIEPWLDER